MSFITALNEWNDLDRCIWLKVGAYVFCPLLTIEHVWDSHTPPLLIFTAVSWHIPSCQNWLTVPLLFCISFTALNKLNDLDRCTWLKVGACLARLESDFRPRLRRRCVAVYIRFWNRLISAAFFSLFKAHTHPVCSHPHRNICCTHRIQILITSPRRIQNPDEWSDWEATSSRSLDKNRHFKRKTNNHRSKSATAGATHHSKSWREILPKPSLLEILTRLLPHLLPHLSRDARSQAPSWLSMALLWRNSPQVQVVLPRLDREAATLRQRLLLTEGTLARPASKASHGQ